MPIGSVVCINVLDVFVSYTDRGFTVDKYRGFPVFDFGHLRYFFLIFIIDCIQGVSMAGVFLNSEAFQTVCFGYKTLWLDTR